MKYFKYKSLLLILTTLCATFSSLSAAAPDVNGDGQINILVLGSTASYSDGNESGVVKRKAFNPTAIASHLENILGQDTAITGAKNVVFKDIHKVKEDVDTAIGGGGSTWVYDYHCYSLMQHFVWPDGKAARMVDLRGEGTGQYEHAWDYIVLCEDPYVMANFPGVYAEGVRMIQSEVAKSSNTTSGQNPSPAPPQILLLAQWPESNPTFSAADFNEIVHRVGNSAALTVVPAAMVWESYNSKDSDAKHPTPRGEYLAAASIYSKLVNKSASAAGSGLNTSVASAIASHALSKVNIPASYSGRYNKINAFHMNFVQKREIAYNIYGTSTERGFRDGLREACDVSNLKRIERGIARENSVDPNTGEPIPYTGARTDFNFSRGSDIFEPEKQYLVDDTRHDYAYGFPMGDHRNTGAVTMLYGIDKRYGSTGWFGNGTDLGVAYSMVREGEIPLKARTLPVRLLWSKINHFQPTFNSHRDGWHLSNELDRAVGAYIYTTTTGRCPVEAEPNDTNSAAWRYWYCRKLGYETAWQMSHLTTRAPGFRIMPSSSAKLTVTSTASETMTVQFINAPESDVTVTINTSNSGAAIISAKTLTFTPQNYNIPQELKVVSIPGDAPSDAFNILFSTTSDDEVYDGLSDTWAYTTTRSSTTGVLSQIDNDMSTASTTQNQPVTINLNATGANAGNTVIAGPRHGSISWSGTDCIYTPDFNYIGTDEFAYAVTNGTTQTIGYVRINIGVADGQVNVVASDASASEEGPDNGSWTINRSGDTTDALNVYYTLGGTANAITDYGVSKSSPVTIPAGQSSVVITLTPIDDNVFGEDDETAVLTITANAAYPIGSGSATITILDNDNNSPEVEAGPDQTITATASVSWSPANLTTAIWLDANDASTITQNAGKISLWSDKSGNNKHAIQSVSANQATLTQAGLNGKNVVNFDGTSGYFDIDLDSLAGVSHSSFIVTKAVTYTDIYGAADASSGANSLHIGFNGTGRYRMNYWGNDFGPNASLNFKTDEANLLNYIWTTGVSKQILANGSSEGSNTSAGNIGTMSGGGRLGKVVNHGYYGGDIAEFIIITGAVSDGDREKMEGYLAHKWGLQGNLPVAHPYRGSPPGGLGAIANLNGTATDDDGDSLTTTWSVVDGPGSVSFADASALITTATFSELGTYILRLTADDGKEAVQDVVTITVSSEPTNIYTGWTEGSFANPFTDTGSGANQDLDSLSNLMEFAQGTDPTLKSDLPLLADGTRNGLPITVASSGDNFDFYFMRRDDHGTSGSVTYTPQFSSDMVTFYDSSAIPSMVIDSSDDADYHVAKVPYTPLLPNGQKAIFGRIKVELVP